jgi:hypothetical protein
LGEHNPYEAPTSALRVPLPNGDEDRRGGGWLYFAWGAVFAVNMIVPLLFGLSTTSAHGRIGMTAASMLFLAWGCWLCAVRRQFAAPLIFGAVLVGVSQLVPILHVIAGLIGLTVGQILGLADTRDKVTSEFGGFVVTFVTGGMLIAASAFTGWLIRSMTPAHWWRKQSAEGSAA